jgi:hypothetical protein
MWIDKDDVFANDKVWDFKASNPEAETHIRSHSTNEFSHSPASTQSQLLTQHTLNYMSSDARSNFAQEYPTGAIADSPIPFSQEHPIHSPIPIIDFTTMQSLNPTTTPFVMIPAAMTWTLYFFSLYSHLTTPSPFSVTHSDVS